MTQITALARTTKERVTLLQLLDSCINGAFSAKKTLLETMSEVLPSETKQVIVTLCNEHKIQKDNTKELLTFLKKIQTDLQELPILRIQLAISPTEHIVNTMEEWIEQHIKGSLLLDIVVDEEIIGGAIFAYQGKYKDFSLQKRLEDENL